MNPTRDDSSWRRIAAGSFVMLLCVALAWNAAAFAIDASGLEQGIDPWVSMWVLSVVFTMGYGGPAILLSLGATVIAAFGAPDLARACAWWTAAVAAACSGGLLQLYPTVYGPPAEGGLRCREHPARIGAVDACAALHSTGQKRATRSQRGPCSSPPLRDTPLRTASAFRSGPAEAV